MPLEGWLAIGALACLAAAALILAGLFSAGYGDAYVHEWSDDSLTLVDIVAFFVALLVLAAVILLTLGLAAVLYKHGTRIIGSGLLAPALVAVGLVLFYLKKKVLFLYGTLEVGAALGVIISVTFGNQGSTAARLAAAATATYFLIRGMDNVSLSPMGKQFLKRRGWLQGAAEPAGTLPEELSSSVPRLTGKPDAGDKQ